MEIYEKVKTLSGMEHTHWLTVYEEATGYAVKIKAFDGQSNQPTRLVAWFEGRFEWQRNKAIEYAYEATFETVLHGAETSDDLVKRFAHIEVHQG